MEKQPIDELFKRKLYDAEIAPSSSAWMALQARLGSKRVIPIWTYMSIAASLILMGSFGWWLLATKYDPADKSIVAQTTLPATKRQANKGNVQLAEAGKMHKRSQVSAASPLPLQIRVANPRRQFTERIIAIKQSTNYARPTQNKWQRDNTLTQTADRFGGKNTQNEEGQLALQTAPIKELPSHPAAQELPNVASPLTSERTLVVSIEAPAKVERTPIQTIAVNESTTAKSGLGNLLTKVKRLKDGEAFAANTDKPAKASRRGFGKFYEDVKESIQNNAADQ